MKVYVLVDDGDSACPDLANGGGGVFSTRELAEEAARNRKWGDGTPYPMTWFTIQETVIDGNENLTFD